jgi:putative peptide zinc metalloprotease protein
MTSTKIQYQLCSLEKEGRYIVVANNNYYKVDKIAFQILENLKQNLSFKKIAELINLRNDTNYYDEYKIKDICQQGVLMEIISCSTEFEDTKVRSMSKAIFYKFNLLNPASVAKLFQSITFLFEKKIYYFLMLISSFASLFFIIYNLKSSGQNVASDMLLNVEVFVLLFSIFFIHEIGHATAAMKHGIEAKGIGFGFYIIFPVLYTDITEIWILEKKKRIQINMAGIYFQLLINMFLIAAYFIFTPSKILSAVIIGNSISIFWSFNPFFKYDGYWVVSDFFDIPNLTKKSNHFLRSFFRLFTRPVEIIPFLKQYPKTLIIYTFLNFSFWLFFFTRLYIKIFENVQSILIEMNLNGATLVNYASLFALLIGFIFLSYILFKKFKNSNYE